MLGEDIACNSYLFYCTCFGLFCWSGFLLPVFINVFVVAYNNTMCVESLDTKSCCAVYSKIKSSFL